MHVIGFGRKAREAYPDTGSAAAASRAVLAFDQNSNIWLHTQGDANLIIATATITLRAGSRVRIDGNASFLGGVDSGVAFLFAGDSGGVELISTTNQSFAVGGRGTLQYLGVLGPQVAGPLTLTLVVNQNSNIGATLANAGENVLILTEILP